MCASPLLLYLIAAICTSPCINGGTCTAPDTCTCDVGWTGMQCETGTVHVGHMGIWYDAQKTSIYQKCQKHKGQHTLTLRYTPNPLSIRLAGSTVCFFQCVAYITGVGHYRGVGCFGETALAICGSTRIRTVNSWDKTGVIQNACQIIGSCV